MKELLSWDTEYSADSVEWCPFDPDIFALGTYQVNSSDSEAFSPDQRKGRLTLHQFDYEGSQTHTVLQTLDNTPAILDMKWNTNLISGDKIFLAVVDAAGNLNLYQYDLELKNLDLKSKITLVEDNGLALSLDWNDRRSSQEEPQIVVSDSKGTISVVTLCQEDLKLNTTYKAHGFEAWIAAFDSYSPNLIYSGGDDCKLKVYDDRVGMIISINNKGHIMGVTSLQSSVDSTNKLYSGSYDEMMKEWDTRNMKQELHEINLNGGVWRIKVNRKDPKIIGTATMHNGFHIIREGVVEGTFKGHESLAYGIDWSWHHQNNLIASCSFYDHRLKLWNINI